MAEILFYLLALATIGFGVGVIATKMPMHSVLCLLGAFFCLAVIYLLAGYQFLAATQLLVYAGAIMVLFLFVIMLLNLGNEEELERNVGMSLSGPRLTLAAVAAASIGLIGIVAAGWGKAVEMNADLLERGLDDLSLVAEVLFSRYMLPFEAASLLLLATMIGVVVLAKRQRTGLEHESAEAGWPWRQGANQ